jgi:hypothetical protein
MLSVDYRRLLLLQHLFHINLSRTTPSCSYHYELRNIILRFLLSTKYNVSKGALYSAIKITWSQFNPNPLRNETVIWGLLQENTKTKCLLFIALFFKIFCVFFKYVKRTHNWKDIAVLCVYVYFVSKATLNLLSEFWSEFQFFMRVGQLYFLHLMKPSFNFIEFLRSVWQKIKEI